MRRIVTGFLVLFAAGMALIIAPQIRSQPPADRPERGIGAQRDPRGGPQRGGPQRGNPGRSGGGRGSFAPPPPPVVTAIDTNKDGEISAEELVNASASLKKLDKNKDGELAGSELLPDFAGGGFRSRGPGGGRGGFEQRAGAFGRG